VAITFDGLSSSDFEGFCSELLHATGYVNVDWRKGRGSRPAPPTRAETLYATILGRSRTEASTLSGGSWTASTSREACPRTSCKISWPGQVRKAQDDQTMGIPIGPDTSGQLSFQKNNESRDNRNFSRFPAFASFNLDW
jgi:hypothetical protein